MRATLAFVFLAVVALFAAGCSTVQSRISSNRAAFNSWPPDVQQKVSAGDVDVGFTVEQVRVALGEPDAVFSRTTPQGHFEVWSFRDRGPRFAFGVGAGSFRGSSGYSTGVSVAGPARPDERMRVTFDQFGRVSAVERFRR
jgi:outer membrane protein assembly factor BamE (lipoprotein component of BamABCDE complex)